MLHQIRLLANQTARSFQFVFCCPNRGYIYRALTEMVRNDENAKDVYILSKHSCQCSHQFTKDRIMYLQFL